MIRPIRLQRSRRPGASLQTESLAVNGLPAVIVTRPGKWGNPFDFRKSDFGWLALSYGCRADPRGRQEASVKAFREWITPVAGLTVGRYERGVSFGNDQKSVAIGPRIDVGPAPTLREIRAELRGRNLACWCKAPVYDTEGTIVRPGDPCHADVLLEIANAEDPS